MKLLLAWVLVLMVGCQGMPLRGPSIRVSVQRTGMAVLVASKKPANVNHYTVKLFRQSDNGLAANGQLLGSAGTTSVQFDYVPDGVYYATAEAFESGDDTVSITQGGAQTSTNTVTVVAPSATYSDAGTGLAVTLALLDGTGGVAQVTVTTGLTPVGYRAWLLDQLGALRAPYTSASATFNFGSIPDGTFRAVVSMRPTGTTSTPSVLADTALTYTDAVGAPSESFALSIPGLIQTFAGGAGIGDGGLATLATLNVPRRVLVAPNGDIYLADASHHRVRRISGGIITTFAGTGVAGFSGDGGQAGSAQVDTPSGLAMDASGNLLVADTGNNRIRKIATNGVITTIAGTGQNGSQGDGGAATAARLSGPLDVEVSGAEIWVADTGNNKIRKIDGAGVITAIAGQGPPGSSGDGGPATSSRLRGPAGVAFVGGLLHIADTQNHKIRRIDGAGTIASVAGTGTAGYSGDGGAATAATLRSPRDVLADGTNYWVTDSDNHVIRYVNAGTVSTVAGTGTAGGTGDGGSATAAKLSTPFNVALLGSDLLIADSANNRIRKVAGGVISTVAGVIPPGPDGDTGPASAATLVNPAAIVGNAGEDIYLTDSGHHRVRVVSAGVINGFAGTGTAGFSGDGGSSTAARLSSPAGIALAGNGDVYIADTGNHRVRRVSGGTISTVAGDGTTAVLNGPTGLTLSGSDVLICDTGNHLVKKLSSGVLSVLVGDGTPAVLNGPTALALAPNGDLYIADTGSHRVMKFSGGVLSVAAGTGTAGFGGDGGLATSAQLSSPKGVYVGPGGDVLIADTGNHRIRRIEGTTITSVAGTGSGGFAGDGAGASIATLNAPRGLWSSSSGTLFLADELNHRIRKIR